VLEHHALERPHLHRIRHQWLPLAGHEVRRTDEIHRLERLEKLQSLLQRLRPGHGRFVAEKLNITAAAAVFKESPYRPDEITLLPQGPEAPLELRPEGVHAGDSRLELVAAGPGQPDAGGLQGLTAKERNEGFELLPPHEPQEHGHAGHELHRLRRKDVLAVHSGGSIGRHRFLHLPQPTSLDLPTG
jgi:hypothetical protein